MPQFFLAAMAGIACGSLLPALPAPGCLPWLAVLAAVLAWPRAGRVPAAAVIGCLLYCVAAHDALDLRLAAVPAQKEFKFTAEVIEFTKIQGAAVQLLVATRNDVTPPRVRLSWYRPAATPKLGEVWEFRARLRRPRGTRNPGGFDYAGWLHRQRIGATGYVLAGRRLDAVPLAGFAHRRQQLNERIETLLPPGDARAALQAIAFGARHAITASAWDRYAVTGTSHLMAISGLHVGLAATGAALLARALLWLVWPRSNLRDLGFAAAVPAALSYTAIAGFALPSQRALVMTMAAVVYLWLRQPPRPGSVLLWTAALLLLIDPLAILAPGFLLSFGAVGVLLFRAQQRARMQTAGKLSASRQWLRELLSMQAVLLFGLLPLTGLLFARTAWLAPLANLLVLPLFSVVTVPCALLGILLGDAVSPVGDGLLWLSWYSLAAVHGIIYWLAELPGSRIALAQPSGVSTLLFLLPLLWVVLPQGFPGRHLAWLGFAAVLVFRPAAPPEGCFDVHALDVGQGLAVVARTRQHTLLYDSGPAYANGRSSADYVVLPFLASQGVKALDAVVISHADNDHAGGLARLLQAIRVDRVLGGESLPTAREQAHCVAGQQWAWDGVRFDMLHPAATTVRDGNNASCVLQISAGPARALLTGDIEAGVERQLLASGSVQPVALVQVPHHGSRTSSSAGFAQRLAAETAIVSAAHRNRWGFPKEDVVARWHAAGSRVLTTASSGAIYYRVCPASGAVLLSEHRRAARRYWHDMN